VNNCHKKGEILGYRSVYFLWWCKFEAIPPGFITTVRTNRAPAKKAGKKLETCSDNSKALTTS
jgi:hypothetical protein